MQTSYYARTLMNKRRSCVLTDYEVQDRFNRTSEGENSQGKAEIIVYILYLNPFIVALLLYIYSIFLLTLLILQFVSVILTV